MTHKEAVKNNFSKYAVYYDRYSTVQNLCASELVSQIEADSFESILDIGCGTGNYTLLLRKKFPGAAIKAVDISRGMIEVAKAKMSNKAIDFLVADGEALDFEERFEPLRVLPARWDHGWPRYLYRYAPDEAVVD